MGFRLYFLLIFILVWAPVGAQAQELCPKRVGYIEKNALTRLVLPIVQDVYSRLGCETVFVHLPGRRGISAFNEERIDAELMRFRLVEDQYLAPFVRGKVPLIQLKSYFWKNPAMVDDHTKPFGYVKGLIWQENYAKGKPFNAFYNTQSMFKAYNTGQIAGFLASGPAITDAHQQQMIKPLPVAVELVKEAPLYHYASSAYRGFMDRFDRYVEANLPFTHISIDQHKVENIN